MCEVSRFRRLVRRAPSSKYNKLSQIKQKAKEYGWCSKCDEADDDDSEDDDDAPNGLWLLLISIFERPHMKWIWILNVAIYCFSGQPNGPHQVPFICIEIQVLDPY